MDRVCSCCSKKVNNCYMSFVNQPGYTICLSCLTKNTWSICKNCNGSLFDCKLLTDDNIQPDMTKPIGEIEAEYNSILIKLDNELTRFNHIYTDKSQIIVHPERVK